MLGNVSKFPEKVIVLDFDGPVTHFRSLLLTCSRLALDPGTMQTLSKICQAANAGLVCSSNRATLDKKEQTIDLLLTAGFNCAAHLHNDWSCSYQDTNVTPPNKQESAAIRDDNILEWHRHHPEVKILVKIDDLKLSPKNFVHVKDIKNGMGIMEFVKICHFLEIDPNDAMRIDAPNALRAKFPAYEP